MLVTFTGSSGFSIDRDIRVGAPFSARNDEIAPPISRSVLASFLGASPIAPIASRVGWGKPGGWHELLFHVCGKIADELTIGGEGGDPHGSGNQEQGIGLGT